MTYINIPVSSGGGSGDVVGPGSATNNAVARWDGTTGELLQDSVVIIGDTGNVTGVADFTATGTTTLAVALAGPLKAASGVVSASAINLASAEVTGVLPVANGGTGASSLTSGKMIFYDGSALASTAAVDYSTSTQNVLIAASGATIMPLVLRGAASQTSRLLQWQDSSANILGSVGPQEAGNQRPQLYLYNTLETTITNYERLALYPDSTFNVFRVEAQNGGTGTLRSLVLQPDSLGKVGIATTTPANTFSVSPVQYSTGTASQSGTTVTGVGTTWTSAMVGSQFIYADGTSSGTITAFGSTTSLTVSVSQTVASQAYKINYTGLQVTSAGLVGIGTTSPTSTAALHVADFNSNNWRFDNTRTLSYFFAAEANPRWQLSSALLPGSTAGLGFGAGSTNTLAATGGAIGATSTTRTIGLYTSNATALTERMRIDGSGNCGFGTSTTSVYRFAIDGGTQTTSLPILGLTQTWNGAGVTFTGMLMNITDTASAAASLLMDVQLGGTSRFCVRKDGNVGIGTTTPSAPLHIIGSSGTGGLRIDTASGSGTGYIDTLMGNTPFLRLYQSTGGYLRLGAQGGIDSYTSAGAARDLTLNVNSGGNVGIGTASPGVALDVVGIVRRLAGTSTGFAVVGGTLFNSITTTGNVTTAETDLFTTSIAANTLATNSDTVEFYSAGTFAATANNKRVRIYFGATAILDTTALVVTTASNWSITGRLIRTGAATQKAIVTFVSSDTTVTGIVNYTTPAETLSGAVTLRVTGQATATNDIVGEFWKGSWQPGV